MQRMRACGIVLLLLTSGSTYGGLIGPRSLLGLGQKADLIVVGTATGTSQNGEAAGLSLQISRVVNRDSALAGSVVTVAWSSSAQRTLSPGTPVAISGNGSWFLRRSSGGWQLLAVMDGAATFDSIFTSVLH